MLFGMCNCGRKGTLSRRSLLRATGVGFVASLVDTLIQASQTAEAQTLGSDVPEVDRLAVRMVTDNEVIAFVPSEKRGSLTIERGVFNMSPDAPPRYALQGEFGLSMHAESRRGDQVRNVLIDFGFTPETLLNNMALLKIDPSKFDALVLSHGHGDHFGGMVGFLQANSGKLKKKLPFFIGGEDCFCTRMAGPMQFGALDREAIIDADLSLMLAQAPALVADHAFTTGRIARVSGETPLMPTLEKVGVSNGFGCFPDKMSPSKNTGTFIPDDFEHEIATVFMVKGKGLVVLTSCSHSGVINTIRQAQSASGIQKVHAIIGGFHIVPPMDDVYIRKITATLKDINPDYIIPGHCSGDRFYDLARDELGNKVIHTAVGTRFIFES